MGKDVNPHAPPEIEYNSSVVVLWKFNWLFASETQWRVWRKSVRAGSYGKEWKSERLHQLIVGSAERYLYCTLRKQR